MRKNVQHRLERKAKEELGWQAEEGLELDCSGSIPGWIPVSKTVPKGLSFFYINPLHGRRFQGTSKKDIFFLFKSCIRLFKGTKNSHAAVSYGVNKTYNKTTNKGKS